jgi:hypothetical protein
MMIQAKPVIPDQYWILRQNDRKVGNIEAEGGGFTVTLNGTKTHIKSLSSLTKTVEIDFQRMPKVEKKTPENSVHGYPTTEFPHNAIFNVQHQLPLWTEEPRSRSWVAAGWYRVKQHRDWRIVQCPKLIVLQRYPYQGPFYTREEALRNP